MAARWTTQQTCSTSTPSPLAGYPGPVCPVYYIHPYLSAFPSQNIINLFCKTLARIPTFWGSSETSKTLQMDFLSLVFPHWNGKGQMSRDAFTGDLPQALLGLMLYCPFPGSTYGSVKLPVDAFSSAWFTQLPEEGCLVWFSSSAE